MRFSVLLIIFIFTFCSSKAQDSLNVLKRSSWDIYAGHDYNDIWGYTDANGNEFAILGSQSAINIIDVTDCGNPVLDTAYVDGSTVIWRDFKTYQHYVYGICDGSACQNEGLEIINMNTGAFKQINTDFGKAHNIFIETNTGRLYVVGTPQPADLLIYDLATDPWNPVLLASINFGSGVPNYIHDIYVKGNIAYASHGWDGYVVYDVSTPTNPINLSDYTTSTSKYNHSSWTDSAGQYAYIAYEVPTGVPIDIIKLDTNNLVSYINSFTQPQIPSAPTNNRPHNPFVKGDSLYISYYHDGIQIWNIQERENPKLVGYYDTEPSNTNYNGYTGSWGIYPFFDSGCIVASDINNGLFTFEVIPPKVIMDSIYVVIDDPSMGIVLKDDTGNKIRVRLDTLANFIYEPYTTSGKSSMLDNTDLLLENGYSSLIFKDVNSRYYSLRVASNNSFYVVRLSGLPDRRIILSGDLIISQKKNYIFMENDAGQLVKIYLNSNGDLEADNYPD